jgi:hypothetical protein
MLVERGDSTETAATRSTHDVGAGSTLATVAVAGAWLSVQMAQACEPLSRT